LNFPENNSGGVVYFEANTATPFLLEKVAVDLGYVTIIKQ
jgi:hypothetical protein